MARNNVSSCTWMACIVVKVNLGTRPNVSSSVKSMRGREVFNIVAAEVVAV